MKEPKKHIDYLSDKDYQKIKECDNLFHRSIMLFIANTGLRMAEIDRLNFADVYDKNWSTKPVLRVTKGKDPLLKDILFREIPLNQVAKECIKVFYNEAKDRLRDNIALDSPLIISKKIARLTREHFITILRNFAFEKGIDKLTPLILRDYFAFSLVKQGTDFKAVQEIMGYRSIVTTHAKYGNSSIENLYKAVNKLNK